MSVFVATADQWGEVRGRLQYIAVTRLAVERDGELPRRWRPCRFSG